MNKKKLILACSLAVSVLAMVGTANGTRQVSAEGETNGTTTYTIESTTSVTTSGDAFSACTSSYSQTYKTKGQMTSGNSCTLNLKATGYVIDSLVLSMKSNSKTGTGNLTINGETVISTSAFNTSSWNGSWSSSYVDVSIDLTSLTNTTLDNCPIVISATANSLYVESYTVGWSLASDAGTKYSVSFESQGGSLVNSQKVNNDGASLATEPEDPTRGGYTFGGWYTNSECSEGNEFSFDTAITGDTTLYAKWVDLGLTTIANVKTQEEGTFFRVTGEVVTKQNASTAIIQDETGGIVLNTPAAFNGIYVGNNITVTGKYTIYNGAQELTELTSIVVNSDDKVVETTPVSEVTNDNFGKYVELTNLKIASVSSKSPYTVTLEGIENYVIFFSSVTEAGFDTTTMTVGKYINVKGAITLFNGLLEVIPFSVSLVDTYNITFETGDGASVASQEIIEGGKVTRPEDPAGYTKDGYRYTFKQWLLNGEAYDFDSVVSSNITLTAEWTSSKIPTSELFADVNTQASLKLSYQKTTVDGEVTEEVSASTNTYLPGGLNASEGFTGNVVYDSEASEYMSSDIYYLDANTGYIDYSIEDITAGDFLVGGYLNIARTSEATVENPEIKYYVEVVAKDGTISKSLEKAVTFESNYDYQYIDEAFDASDLTNAKALRLRYTVDQEADKYYAYYEFSVEGEAKKTEKVEAYENFSNVTMQFRYESDLVANEDVLENGLFIMNDTNGFTTDGTLPTTGTKYENTEGGNTLTIAIEDIALNACKGKVYVAAYIKDESGYHFGKVRELSVSSMINVYLGMSDEDVTPEAKAILTALLEEINK